MYSLRARLNSVSVRVPRPLADAVLLCPDLGGASDTENEFIPVPGACHVMLTVAIQDVSDLVTLARDLRLELQAERSARSQWSER